MNPPLMNDSVNDNEALLFITPSEAMHESHDVLKLMPWPLLIIGAMLKFIEWLERIV